VITERGYASDVSPPPASAGTKSDPCSWRDGAVQFLLFFDFSGKRGASMVSLLAVPRHDIGLALPSSPPLLSDPESVRFRWRYGDRLHTDSVYRPRPTTTYSILLAHSPCFDLDLYHYHQLALGLAPHPRALEAYRTGAISWDGFARRYLSELAAFPYLRTRARQQIATILSRYASVTLLGMELPCVPAKETSIHCVRRLVHAWLLGAMPVEVI
jgi:hypothetical protein